MIDIPEMVRAAASANPGGLEWLDGLPATIELMAHQWGLELGEAYRGGTAGLVIAAQQRDVDLVLKLPMVLTAHDRAMVDSAVAAHRHANGRGCAALVRYDLDTPALLLERLGHNLDDAGLAVPEILEAIASTLMLFWQPATELAGLMNGAEKAAWLTDYISRMQHKLNHPYSPKVIDRALVYCRERAAEHDPAASVLCHADAHGWNTCVNPAGGYKFVDPEGVVAERALDLAVPMREYNESLLAGSTLALLRHRAEMLAERCDVAVGPVWQWGFIERVSTGLANLHSFGPNDAKPFYEVAVQALAWDPA